MYPVDPKKIALNNKLVNTQFILECLGLAKSLDTKIEKVCLTFTNKTLVFSAAEFISIFGTKLKLDDYLYGLTFWGNSHQPQKMEFRLYPTFMDFKVNNIKVGRYFKDWGYPLL